MNLKEIAMMGIVYSSTSNTFSQIIQILTKLILARLLLPQYFGLMAAVLSITNIINIFFNLGWGEEIIQRKQDSEKALGNISVVFLISSVVLTISSFLGADKISFFLNQPELASLLKIYSISFIIYATTIIYLVYMQKNLLFKKKAFCEIFSNVIFALLAITLAKLDFGVWSLLLAQLIQSIVLLASFIISTRWMPALTFDWKIFKSILIFVKETAAGNMFSISILYVDNLFVAKFLGVEQLGFYTMAFSLASIPIISISHSIAGTMFPIFSKAKDNLELKMMFLKTIHLNFLILLPLTGIGIALTDTLIGTILSQKWAPIIFLIRILLIYAILRSFCIISSCLVLSKSKPKVTKKIFLLEFLILIAIIIPGLNLFGIYGVLLAVLSARLTSAIIFALYVKKSLSISMQEYFSTLFSTVKITCMTIIILLLLKNLIFGNINIFNLFCLLFIASISLCTFTFLFDKQSFFECREAIEIIKNKIVRKYHNLRGN